MKNGRHKGSWFGCGLVNHLFPLLLVVMLASACDVGMEEYNSAPAASVPRPDMSRSEGQQGQQRSRNVMTSNASLSFAAKSAPVSEQPPVAAPQPAPTTPSMIIRNGRVSVQVDSLELAMEAVRQMATSLGGYIGNVTVNTGERQVRSATLQMKVPAPRFEEVMSGMKSLGKVENSTATAEDVTEEFVDVSARVANGKRMEERLVSLLATRTGTLEDVLAVERELARVREEIERMEGRIRFLSSRVATSTIDVTVHEKAPLLSSQPGTNVIARAFVNGWRNFVTLVAASIESLGTLLPIALILWLLFWGARRWRREVVRRRAAE